MDMVAYMFDMQETGLERALQLLALPWPGSGRDEFRGVMKQVSQRYTPAVLQKPQVMVQQRWQCSCAAFLAELRCGPLLPYSACWLCLSWGTELSGSLTEKAENKRMIILTQGSAQNICKVASSQSIPVVR